MFFTTNSEGNHHLQNTTGPIIQICCDFRDDVVGMESLTHFGEYEDDSVFVRNDRLKCDYEILMDERTYSGSYFFFANCHVTAEPIAAPRANMISPVTLLTVHILSKYGVPMFQLGNHYFSSYE